MADQTLLRDGVADPVGAALPGPGYAAPSARAGRVGWLAWYRRHYLLVNVPVLLLLTELALAHFNVVNRLPFKDSNDLVAALARVDARPPGGAPTVALLGNSSIREGGDQKLIEQALSQPDHPLRVYNFGLSAARLDAQYPVVEALAARGITPTVAVVGVNAVLVDDQVNQDTVYPWVTRTSPYVFFHRSRFRTALQRGARYAVASPQKKKELLAQWDSRAQFKFNRSATPQETKGFIEKFVGEFGQRRPEEYPMVEDLPRFLGWLQQRGIEPYVVVLPINPLGARKAAGYQPLMAAIRAKLPPDRTLDLDGTFPPELLFDMGHVTAEGRERVSQEIAQWLRTKKPFMAS